MEQNDSWLLRELLLSLSVQPTGYTQPDLRIIASHLHSGASGHVGHPVLMTLPSYIEYIINVWQPEPGFIIDLLLSPKHKTSRWIKPCKFFVSPHFASR